METLIGILLFMGLVAPDNQYYEHEIYQMEQDYYEEVQSIREDPDARVQADMMYQDFHQEIIVLDDPVL